MTATHPGGTASRRKSAGFWAVFVLALVILVTGVLLFLGGIWLLTLGGTFYYAVAGVGLIATAFFLMRSSMLGLWVYLLTYLFTLVWAFWEVGMDWWAQVPRLVGPTVILVLVLLCIPVLRKGSGRRRV